MTAIAFPTERARYLSCAETAKMVRAVLKAAFPAVKFSVRSSNYSMGASIDVSWTDGPTVSRVRAITDQFEGADFDGMQDMKVYRDATRLESGELVRFGADYIHTSRTISPELANRCIKQVVEYWGGIDEIPEAVPAKHGNGYELSPIGIGHRAPRSDMQYDWHSYIHQSAGDRSRFTRGLTDD